MSRKLKGKIKLCSSLLLISVEDGLSRPGCPICRLVREVEERTIKDILYEGVNDLDLRSEFRKSLGLCPYHAWLFAEVATKPEVLDGLGATVIYEDMLSQYVEALSRGETASEGECFLCRFAREFEEIYISNFV